MRPSPVRPRDAKRRPAPRSLSAIMVLIAAGLMMIPAAGSSAAPAGTFSASASSAALELVVLAVNPANLEASTTVGVTSAGINSSPVARSRGAGVCEVLAPGESLGDVPCTAGTIQSAETSSGVNDPPKKCGQGLPAPLSTIATLDSSCGDARAQVVGADPGADSLGEVSRLDIKLDFAPLDQSLEGEKDELLTEIGEVLGPTISDDLEGALIGSLSGDASAVAAAVGNATSAASSSGNLLKARGDSAGATVGIIGVPVCDPTCATSADPLTDGLVIVEMSDAFAEATWDGGALAGANAKAAAVTVRVRDLTKPGERAYLSPITLTASQPSTTVLPPPVETTITIGTPTTNRSATGASSMVAGVEIHALKSIGETSPGANNGGVRLRIASADAFVMAALTSTPTELPRTGWSILPTALGSTLLAAGLLLGRFLRRESEARV